MSDPNQIGQQFITFFHNTITKGSIPDLAQFFQGDSVMKFQDDELKMVEPIIEKI